MRLALVFAIPLSLLCQMPAALGQMRDNQDKELSCQDHGFNRQIRKCDLHEQTIASPGHLNLDPGPNGGVTVKGWNRNDVLVRYRTEAWADTDGDANTVMNLIHVDISSNGSIVAHGPTDTHRRGWSVSYEIFAPHKTSVEATTVNGGIFATDVEGFLQVTTVNGGVHLARIAGEVKGTTVNGGVDVNFTGSVFSGVDLTTTNGGVSVSLPAGLSAHLQARTVNGSIYSDFPMVVSGHIGGRNLDANLGSGGPLIHLTTVNGGITLKRG